MSLRFSDRKSLSLAQMLPIWSFALNTSVYILSMCLHSNPSSEQNNKIITDMSVCSFRSFNLMCNIQISMYINENKATHPLL
jgi:hypothetical protein